MSEGKEVLRIKGVLLPKGEYKKMKRPKVKRRKMVASRSLVRKVVSGGLPSLGKSSH